MFLSKYLTWGNCKISTSLINFSRLLLHFPFLCHFIYYFCCHIHVFGIIFIFILLVLNLTALILDSLCALIKYELWSTYHLSWGLQEVGLSGAWKILFGVYEWGGKSARLTEYLAHALFLRSYWVPLQAVLHEGTPLWRGPWKLASPGCHPFHY